jgi:predicted dehydrogenase
MSSPAKHSSKKRIAIIGCGQMGMWHAEAYRKNTKIEIAAFVDTDINKAKRCAERFGGQVFSSHQQLIEQGRIDGVNLCTIPVTHRDIVVDLLNAGIHVLCEKPLAISPQEAHDMIQAGEEKDRYILTAFKFRFFEEVMKAKDLLDKAGLGKILHFRLMFGGYCNVAGTWYANPKMAGGGIIMDNGPHAFDLVRYLLGEIDSVSAHVSHIQGLSVEDTAQMTCSLRNGGRGVIDLSWSSTVPSKTYLEIYGEDGTILLDFTGFSYKFKTWNNFKYVPNQMTIKDAFARQNDHFINAMSGVKPSVTVPEDGLRSQELIEQAYMSTLQLGGVK